MHHRHNQQNYEPGYDFEELWRYDILSGAWAYLPLPADAPSPGKRYLAALTAISHTLLLYGGLQEGQGDVWAYYTMAGRWELLHEDRPMGPSSPGRRMGHSIIPFETPKARGFLLYGGRSVGADDKPVVHADVWFFDLDARAWREVHPDGVPMPEGRTYHALFDTLVPTSAGEAVHVAVAAGGTTTTPRLSCASDAWLFVVDCEARSVSWKKLPDMPVALYDLAGAAYGKDAFLHGGHLCSLDDTKTFPYYYTNLAVHLDLSQHLPAAGSACVVKHVPKQNYVKLASLTSTDL